MQLRQKMKWIIIVVCVAFVATLLYVGGVGLFGGGQPVQAVARVNGEVISAADVQQVYFQTVNLYRQFGQNVSPIQRHSLEFNALQQLVDYELMVQAAKRERVKVDEREINDTILRIKNEYGDRYAAALRAAGMTERDLRNALREQLMVETLRKERSTVDISDEELRRVYEESLQEIEVRHILIEPETVNGELDWSGALKTAEELLQRIRAGEDFAEIAAVHSADTGSSVDGGNLGWIDRDTPFVQEFLDAAFGLEVGEVSDPVRTSFGYHLIQVTDSRVKEERPFDEVRDSLKARLEAERGFARFQEWLDEERSKARIEILAPQYMAIQLMLNNRIDQAIAQYREAIAVSPLDAYLYYHLANALEEVEAHDEALEAYLKAAELGRFDPELWFALGQAYRRQENFEQAKDAYLKASEYAPNNLSLHQALAVIFEGMGYEDLAAEQAAKADEILELLLAQEQERQAQIRAQEELLRQLEEAALEAQQGVPGVAGQADSATGEPQDQPQD